MDDEFHVLMAHMGLRNYAVAVPISGNGQCVITFTDLPGPRELMAIAEYFHMHETQAIVLRKE